MRNLKIILIIFCVLILFIPNIGICEKIEFEGDQLEDKEKGKLEEERNRIGDTYTIEVDKGSFNELKFCSEETCDFNKEIIIKENIDFKILDKIKEGLRGKLYKVILDPDGEKVTAYLEEYKFDLYDKGYDHKFNCKSKMSDKEKQILIANNEKKKAIEKQEEKRIAQQKVKERQKKVEQSRREKIAQIKKKHPYWDDNTMQDISAGRVHIGMTKEQAIASWGKPNTVNRTITANRIHEQWVYGIRNYLYFENDILTTIQN